MRVIGVIQARMGSTRLPGKVLLPLNGRPIIGHIRDRLDATGCVGEVVVATTADPRNDALATWAEGEGLRCIRHPGEDDIAGRMALVFAETGADAMLKCNGDCPLVDPSIMRQMVMAFEANAGLDYLSNKVRFTFPIGMSVEIIGRHAIEWCDRNLSDPVDRELICNLIRDDRPRFKVASFELSEDLSRYSLMVDEPHEYEEMAKLFDNLGQASHLFGLVPVLAFLGHPDRDMTTRTIRMDGAA